MMVLDALLGYTLTKYVFDSWVLAKGVRRVIIAAHYRGRYPALEFLAGLGETDQAKMMALLDHAADSWPIQHREKFKKVEGEIWEFKNYQIRLFCFQERDQLIVATHGIIKKQEHHRREDIDRALAIKEEHDATWDAESRTYRERKGAK